MKLEGQTLGQRIQTGRRNAGLSQETLGERLEVSRQAVSKWESDSAIPELEKLIVMSRLFGVSLGELLGVESPEESESEATRHEQEMAEVVAAQYASRETQIRRKMKVLTAGMAAGVLALVLAAGMMMQVWNLEQRLGDLQTQMQTLQSDMGEQISASIGQLDHIVAKNDEILSDFTVTVTGFDLNAGMVTLTASARPKERTTDTTASFTARLSDGQVMTVTAALEADRYTAANWTVPMAEQITVSASFTTGDTVRTSQWEEVLPCAPENFQLQLDGTWEVTKCSDGQVALGKLALNIKPALYSTVDITPETVEVCLYRGREREPEQILPVPQASELFERAGLVGMEHTTGYGTSFSLKPGETVTAALRVVDNYGQTRYHVLHAFAADEDGIIKDLRDYQKTNPDGSVVEVYSDSEKDSWFAGWQPGLIPIVPGWLVG